MYPSSTFSRRSGYCGAIAAFGMAGCYLAMAVIFFGLLTQPEQADTLQKIQYIRDHHLLIASSYTLGYLVFGFLLAVLVLVFPASLPKPESTLVQLGSLFGRIWVVLMMATGMMTLLSLSHMFRLADTQPTEAVTLYHVHSLLSGAFGGGIELVGGLWVLLLSLAGLQQQSKTGLHWLGLLVGIFGVATLWHTQDDLKDAFGLTQLVWLLWLGIALMRQVRCADSANTQHVVTPTAQAESG